MPDTSVIIPVFNRAPQTAECLRNIVRCGKCEVIVVDDASTDETPHLLAGFGGAIRVVTHPTNSGFAMSCNDGAAAASGSYLVFLNNDTVPQPGWLEALVRYAEGHPQAAVVGSKLLYQDNTIQHAGVVICQDRYPRHIYTGFPAGHPAVNKSRRFQIVTAACMLVRRCVFEQAGGFDKAFRNGFEDVDFCLRLGEQGHEIHYCADSVVQHLGSVSPGRFKNDRDNVALYRQRWIERVQPDDLHYYGADGLLTLSYEGLFPLYLRVSPLLAVLDGELRTCETEKLLGERARQVADLRTENTRLRLALGASDQDSPMLQYDNLRQRIREAALSVVPQETRVLVVSKGDSALLNLEGRKVWHFPQNRTGAYAGCHPADSAEAISHLEVLRAKGAEFLVIPVTSLWWLDHYAEFRQHLENRYVRVLVKDDACVIFDMRTEQLRVGTS